MDPDLLSGSDDDWGVEGFERGSDNGEVQVETDDEGVSAAVLRGAGGGDDDDNDDDNDEDDEDDTPVQEEEEDINNDDDEDDMPRTAPPAKNTMHQFLTKKGVPGQKTRDKVAVPHAQSKVSPKPAKVGGKVPPAARGGGRAKQKATFTPHSDDSDGYELDTTVPTNPGVSLPAADPMQEFEDQRTATTSAVPPEGAASADPPGSVHCSAHQPVYVMKNEKVNKWFEVKSLAILHAADVRNIELFNFTTEELTITSKTNRVAMQEKLVDEQGTKVVATVRLIALPTDGMGSGAGPGMISLMMVIPYNLKSVGTEMEDLRNKLEQNGRTVGEIVGLMALDPEIVKRAYKINKCPLPSVYNPNTNSCNKYRVQYKLEEQAKSDTNFTLIGPIEKTKRAPKRASEDAAGSNKADQKRTAKEARQASASDEREAWMRRRMAGEPGAAEQEVGTFHAQMSALPGNINYAQMECAENEVFSVMKAGKGKWLLFKSLAP